MGNEGFRPVAETCYVMMCAFTLAIIYISICFLTLSF